MPRPGDGSGIAPRSAAARPGDGPGVAPRPATPRPGGLGPRPAGPRAPGGPGGDRGPRTGPPRFRRPSGPPPTVEQVLALAKKERVPARIAKGDLEGKMKCRIWRKLHAEEAKRFDQAYTLMEQHPGLELADAFGVAQSGLSVQDFLARKARTQKRTELKEARGSIDNAAIKAWIERHIAEKSELTIVLGERTLLDVMTAEDRASFTFARAGRVEKLQVVLICGKPDWDARVPTLDRDSKLAQKPASVARQPDQRPVSDPRDFLDLKGQKLWLALRNGIRLFEELKVTGPFDVLLGPDELFVPLHAILKWDRQPPAPAPAPT